MLETAEPDAKRCAAAQAFAALARADLQSFAAAPPDRPARPARPILVAPADVPRRKPGSLPGRVALLHAIAHIEFNAIDLAFDMAARFAAEIDAAGLDATAFVRDWAGVGADEARHFAMLAARLEALGARYGDLPAHDGLWDAATATRGGVLLRLAVAPMGLEARGLDVTPAMRDKLIHAGDTESASVLGVILADEIGHVAAGARWFAALCANRGLDPEATFRQARAEAGAGAQKPPFNIAARTEAGLPPAYYIGG